MYTLCLLIFVINMLSTASVNACPNPILLLKSISDIVFVDKVNIYEAEASITAEICGNGLDDDGDNLIDCEDPDCYLSESASTDVPKSISATTATTVTSVLNITESGTIEDLNIKNLDITHTWINDVVVRLISPANTNVLVLNQPCNGENNIYMTLDDEASTGTFPCPPIDGQSYQPSNLLSAFDGEEMNGTWTLTVQDVYGSADGGSLDGWSLEITKECVQLEICDNGIDDDGDGLTDSFDPDCTVECNTGCSNIYEFSWLSDSGDGNTWEITNGENSLTRVYPISGPLGTYNVSVTLDNPDGQNIDFSNCGTAGNHFYTATCNDPNATADCDGDSGTADGQFSYGCDYLTFGITADNSNQTTSITYSFEYPSEICDLRIGDIDYQGSGYADLESWQDEIDVVADSLGTPVALNAIVGSKVNVNNNNTANLNLVSIYGTEATGNITPDDVDGHAIITSLGKVTSITFTYSNGPDDDGLSDDHAIRINGFEFCPTPLEICDNGIDDDGDGLIDCEDGNCSENSTCIECNMLENTEFNNNTAFWELSNTSPATASFSIDNSGQLSGENSAFIDITNSTGTNWHTQFRTSGTLSIDANKTYDISFDAKATANKVINLSLQQTGSPYTTYYYSSDITITPDVQTYTINNVTVSATATDALFKFYLNIDDSDVWLDNIVLEESSCTPFEGFDNEVCYFISDGLTDVSSAQDTFYTFNYVTSAVTPIGPTGTYSIEAMAMDTINEVIYAVDSDDFGVVNPTTGSFSVINSDIGDVNGAEGVLNIGDVDGMTFDHTNNIIWATERRDGGASGEPDDLLFQINPANGNPIADAFGVGIDYVVVSTPENDIDDIALADDGTLYAISNYGGSGNQAFGFINKSTGAWTEMGDYGVEDVESLAFTATGQLIATTGKDGSQSDQLYTIDAGTGIATFVGSILPGHDVEACDCISANLINLQIGDKVWADINNDGIQDIEEPGVSGVTVKLLTSSGSPYLAGGSPVTTTTDALGNYIFDGLSEGQYMVEFVLPSGTSFSPQDAGADDEKDSDVNISNGRSGLITLANSVNDLSIDAGLLNANVVIRDCSNGGELFVADNSGNIKRYDPSTGTFMDDFITGLDGPIEMVVGSDDWLYISNSNANSIDKYSLKTGVLIESITDKVDDPHGMTIGPDGNIYINNDDQDEVLKLDVVTGITSVFVSSAAGGLDGNKWGIEFGPDGNLYVASFYTDEVIRYNGTTGAFMDIFVTANETNCNAPSDLTFGPDGNLYVAGKYNDKVAQYNGSTGAYMGGFVTYQSGGLQDPVHVNFGGDGYLYVSSQSNQVGVLKYNATTGTFVENFAAAPGPNGILFAPVPDCVEICDNEIDDDGDGDIDCEDLDCGFVQDRQFNNGLSNWFLYIQSGNTATSSIDGLSKLSGVNSAYIDITTASGTDWGIQFGQGGFSIEEGKTYDLHFEALASANKTINLSIQLDASPYTSYFSQDINVETGALSFDFQFTATATVVGQINMMFNLGETSDDIWIDNVQFKEACLTLGPENIYAEAECADVGSNFVENSDANASGGNYIQYLGATDGSNPPTTADGWIRHTAAVESAGFYYIYARTFATSVNDDSWWVRINEGSWINFNNIPVSADWEWNKVWDADNGNTPELFEFQEGINTIDFAHRESGAKLDKIYLSSSETAPTGFGGAPSNCPETFACDSKFYQTIEVSGEYWLYEIQTSPMAHQPLVNLTNAGVKDEINNTSFNKLEGYIYTINIEYPFRLYRIGGDLSVHYLGNVSGLPADAYLNAADFGPDGKIYVRSAFEADIYELDVTDLTSLNASLKCDFATQSGQSNNVGDIAYNPIDGFYYGTRDESTVIVKYDLVNCTESSITASQYLPYANGAFYIGADGMGYGYQNGDGNLLRINLQTGVVDTVGTSIATAQTDGCSCEGIKFIKEVEDVCVDESSTTTYTFTIYNNWYTPLTNINFRDTLADGLTWASEPYDIVGGTLSASSITGNSIGNFTISSLPIGSISFKIDANIPSGYSGAQPHMSQAFLDGLPGLLAPVKKSDYPETPEIDDPTPLHINLPITILGDQEICIGETTSISPLSGGQWTSNDPGVATITNAGTITGVSAGTTSFIFTNNDTGCSSTSQDIVVHPDPVVSVTGPTSICEGFTSQLTPTSGGTWMSNDPSVATVTNGGVVTGITPGSTTFVFTNTTTGCVSDNSQPITVNEIAEPEITGPTEFCIGSTTTLTPSMGGTWVSSDTMIATVSNNGIVTGVAPGTASFTFTSDAGCVSDPTADITVDNQGQVTITGDPILCIGEETTLEASAGGGTWLIDNPSVATISLSGIVTAISAGTATVTYDHDSQSCPDDPIFEITVNETPVVTIDGAASVCVGENTQLSTTGSGGSWSSSDENIAIVSSSGLVVGVSAGVATFTYANSNGCESEASGNITVDPEVEVSIDFNGSLCLEDDSQLSAIVSGGTTGFSYSWTGPNGFTGSTQTISIVDDGNYNVTVTDSKGCTASTSAFVYEAYEPFIFTLNSEVCEGEDVTLSVNGGSGTTYQWGPNAGNATSSSVTVTPGVPSTTYFVTVTNSIGCSTTASATIDVIAKPVVSITGSDNICVGTTTQLSPTSGGTWTSSDYSVANVDNNGVVTGLGSGTATFTFKDNVTDCYSDPTEIVTVSDNDEVTITGDDQLCIGMSSMLTSSVAGGTWSSSNETVVTIDANTGEVTPNVQGNATITYTPPPAACYATTNYNVNVYNSPVLSINGPSTICEGDITYVTSNTTGTWTSSDESIAIVSVSGEVTGVGPGTAYFSFVSTAGCSEDLDSPITIIASPEVSITGPSSICISGTTTLSPTSGGVWISNNTSIATVNSSGVVTGVAAGNASFTFIESTNGCVSDNNLVITVEERPAISAPANNLLCIEETTTITPASGGSWSSSNPGVATISNEGLITAISNGQAVFTFTSDLTGCQSLASSPVTVQNKPSINFTGPTEVCPDETSTITPSSGGFWSSTDVSIAIISNQGNITAVSPGTVRFIFTDGNTGCVSDSSQLFTVTQPSAVSVTGPSQICIGETTTVSPSSGGTWSSSDANIATVSNAGIVTAIAPGTVTFTFVDATGCSSEATSEVFVDPGPTVSYLGSSSICIGETTTMSPSTGGTWVSSDPTKATITNSGLVTALAQGTVTLTFTNSSTGCSKDADADLVIYAPPSISITGDDEICIGETTNLSPTFGGAWISNNTAVASISSNGVVTGINAGTVTFTFVETATGCYSEESAPITVLPAPVVSIDGPNTICAGSTTHLSPSTGGTWTSDNVSVATVSNTGIVTGISQGLARFTFTSNEGCSSSKTSPVIVFDSPNAIITGPSSICIGSTSQMMPSTGGTWTSSDTTVATIDNNGVVTGITPGTTTFIFTDTNTSCISDPSDPMTVEPNPTTSLIGPSEICIGGTTNMTPLSGGVWTSLNPDIATIENNGEIIGVSNGIAKFIFTDLGTGCVSDTTSGITVLEGIELTFNGPTNLCIGDTTYILPSTGGTWESNNTSVATITNSGMIISVGSGTVTFKYTDSSSGCVSLPSEALTVNGSPAVSVAGASEICINSETHLTPSSGGTWTSLHPAIASVDANGVVTGNAEGIAYFEFTDDITGCVSEDEIAIEVQTAPTIEILDGNTLCLGYTKALSPALAGIWQSSNPEIATISNTGVVTARAPGVVTFSYMDPISGCSTLNDSDPITIVNCTNHDFNVTLKNEVVYGDLNTNDKIDNSAEYGGNINLVSKPLGSIYSLNVNIDGTYSFEADMAGKYVFNVPICLPPITIGCEGTTLEINVLDNVFVVSSPLANLEYTTTYSASLSGNPGEMVVIDAMANDTCVYGGGCALDPSTLSLVGSPGSGSVVISGSNKIEYTPDADFIGLDTIDYTICMMDGITCTQSQQIIIVNHTSAINSTVANDDFYYTFRETEVSGNVLNNDSDPEADGISVLSTGSAVSPVIIPEGEYYIESNGQFSFTPADDFVGTLNIVYTICDNQSEPYCTDATIHLLVLDDLSLNIRVYLEGALINNGGEETLEGLPLMRDDLRVSPHTGQNYIPTSDPYTFDNDPYAATETMFTKMGPGLLNKNQFITDSLGVFSVEGRDAIVDWVHVEIRSKADSTQILGTRSGLVQRDGDVVDLDGVASLRFQGVNVDSFYVVVKHRSHLGAMSLKVTNEELIDFTDQNFPVYDFGTSHSNGFDYTGLARKNTVAYGFSALWAGDFDSNGKVKFANPDDDQNLLFLTVLFSSPEFLINYDNAYGYYTSDYDMSSKAKYTNPNDDLNYLFSQILLYPLNTSFLSNFSSMIEQVPE